MRVSYHQNATRRHHRRNHRQYGPNRPIRYRPTRGRRNPHRRVNFNVKRGMLNGNLPYRTTTNSPLHRRRSTRHYRQQRRRPRPVRKGQHVFLYIRERGFLSLPRVEFRTKTTELYHSQFSVVVQFFMGSGPSTKGVRRGFRPSDRYHVFYRGPYFLTSNSNDSIQAEVTSAPDISVSIRKVAEISSQPDDPGE